MINIECFPGITRKPSCKKNTNGYYVHKRFKKKLVLFQTIISSTKRNLSQYFIFSLTESPREKKYCTTHFPLNYNMKLKKGLCSSEQLFRYKAVHIYDNSRLQPSVINLVCDCHLPIFSSYHSLTHRGDGAHSFVTYVVPTEDQGGSSY